MEKLLIELKVNIYTLDELPDDFRTMAEAARNAARNAYAPYSNFHVGAAVMLANGRIVTGANQENVAYPSGLCAERVALFAAGAEYPDTPVRIIAVAAEAKGKAVKMITPCGACRQVMLETQKRSGAPLVIILCGAQSVYVIEDASSMLPLSFDSI